jgi:ZIP family zinc transporter
VSGAQIPLLGAIAGLTIFLGLPIGRLSRPVPRLKAALNAISIGVLVFLVWDILSHAWQPTDEALAAGRWGAAATGGTVMVVGLVVGMVGLVRFDRGVSARRVRARSDAARVPVAAGAGGLTDRPPVQAGAGSAPGTTDVDDLALMIAVGIGLHNFAEGLAIGSSAASGEVSLAVLLVLGFALHNGTEGFGIVAPLVGAPERPSWGRLALLGLIAGGPTFLGTVIGQRVVNDTLSTAFLGLAAGSVLYVVIELLAVARLSRLKELTTWCILAGLGLGFVTDGILVAAGA